MPVSPVIFDDGGSTRLKHLIDDGPGEMNGLLNVDMAAKPAKSSHAIAGPFTRLRVVAIDRTGVATTPEDSPLVNGDNFTIVSDNGQTVKGAINAAGQVLITVEGSDNNPPLMEAKQFKHKRRYIVANAGPIVTIDGVANGAAFHFAARNAIYSTLVIS